MRRQAFLGAGILAVLAVGACSTSSGGGDNGSAAGGIADAPARTAPQAASATKAAPGLSVAGGGLAADRAHGAASAGAALLPLDDGTYKIRVAELTVAVKGARNVAGKAEEARAIAERAGGEVDSDNRTTGRDASASMELRVPPETLGDTLAALGLLGEEQSRALSTTDVTQKVADVDSRVRSARDSIARLRVLFARAHKIGDIIAIESELNSREADLEALEAQQRSLARQTAMATIRLSLVAAPKKPAPPPAERADNDHGFLGGLERGWDGFVAAAVWVSAAIGTVLPFLVLLFLLAVGGRVLWPRLPHRQHPTPAPTPSE